jgi:GWxTD domain-containing protein
MKRHKRNLYSFILLTSIIVFSTMWSCSTSKKTPVDTKDISYIYNPTRNSFNPAYYLNTQSDESVILAVRFLSNDLFFSEANPEGIPTAAVLISVKLFQTDQGRILADTASYNINIIRDPNRREYIYNLPLKVKKGNKYMTEVKILDRLRMMVSQAFVPFNTLSPLNKYNFVSVGYFNKNQLFSQVLRVDEYINLLYSRGPVDSLYISYFKPFSEIPDAPSMMLPQKTVDYEPMRIVALPYSDTLPIMLPKEGIFLCSVERDIRDGYAIMNFGPSYPNMTTPEEMIEPLIYLAPLFEIEQMRSSSKPKLALDDFWIKCGGNIEKARELIRIFYTRVVYSNVYFTSYAEGWRTERGMIYIIYGPPDKVYKSSEGETWGYRKPVVKSSWGGRYSVKEEYLFFNFKQRENVFSDNDYYLSRSETLVTYWDQAVLSWRKGIVFRLDNPEDF